MSSFYSFQVSPVHDVNPQMHTMYKRSRKQEIYRPGVLKTYVSNLCTALGKNKKKIHNLCSCNYILIPCYELTGTYLWNNNNSWVGVKSKFILVLPEIRGYLMGFGDGEEGLCTSTYLHIN